LRCSRALFIALLITLVSGCGKGSSNSSTSAYEKLLAEEANRAAEALKQSQIDVSACMTSSGFRYVQVPAVQLPNEEFHAPSAETGYGLADSLGRKQTVGSDPNTQIRDALSAADQNAYDVKLQQCIATSPSLSTLSNPTLDAAVEKYTKALESDPEMIAIRRQWSTCMKTRGWDVRSSSELFDRVLLPPREAAREKIFADAGITELETKKLRTFEILVAKAEIKCKAATRSKEQRIQARYERPLLVEYQTANKPN
jgi:hypothetical protein